MTATPIAPGRSGLRDRHLLRRNARLAACLLALLTARLAVAGPLDTIAVQDMAACAAEAQFNETGFSRLAPYISTDSGIAGLTELVFSGTASCAAAPARRDPATEDFPGYQHLLSILPSDIPPETGSAVIAETMLTMNAAGEAADIAVEAPMTVMFADARLTESLLYDKFDYDMMLRYLFATIIILSALILGLMWRREAWK